MKSKAHKIDSFCRLQPFVGLSKHLVAEISLMITNFVNDLYLLRNRHEFLSSALGTILGPRIVAKDSMNVNDRKLLENPLSLCLAELKTMLQARVQICLK